MLVACDIEVQQATFCEPISGHVFCYTKSSWAFNFDSSPKPFYNHQDEFPIENNCLLCGICVVIPTKLQERILTELHKTYLGMSRMNIIVRRYIWWPILSEVY